MPGPLTPRSSLATLKKEAKRWLKALRAADPEARKRFERALSDPPPAPTLRDVQLALARESGFAGWTDLVRALERRSTEGDPRDTAIRTLLSAAERGDADRVAEVLDAWPDIVSARAELPGHSGRRSALHFAMNGIHEDVVDVLLARGADPNVRDDGDNAMPLHFAAERGHLAVVRKLIEHGADPIGAGDMHELEAIGWATCFEYAFHRDVAEYLLAHGARHTIFSAVAMGDAAAIRQIAERSPSALEMPMDHTNRRRRPLHLAVLKRRSDSLAALLELGADSEATDLAGLTALDQAALAGATELAQRLIEGGARVGLPAALALGRTTDTERLLHEDPHCLRPGGRWGRLIIRAAERAPGHVIEMLIRNGASVHIRDDHATAVDRTHGYTALHAAAFSGNAEAVRVLLRHGADPTVREDRYWGTPAGWADHAGHADVRDLILEGPIDLFDALAFDRLDRMDEILARDPRALERRIGVHLTGKDRTKPWLDAAWTPLAYAVANAKVEAVRALLDRGADTEVRDSAGRTPAELAREKGDQAVLGLLESRREAAGQPGGAISSRATTPGHATTAFDERVADFLLMACADWRVSGSVREVQALDALRLVEREPALARANLHTAVVCGELDEARRLLDEEAERVSRIGGPRGWPPILYLCATRLPSPKAIDGSVELLRLLLDRGADPNAFYLGGNADIHYTALTCVLGRGEERAPMHPRAREMAALLLERGADPHDNQVLYNVFADNTSRDLLDDDIVWLLELMHEHSVHRGHAADWKDPTWPMFDMRGAPSLGDDGRVHHGARFLLDAAVDRNLPRMAEWLLEHGAGPNTPPGELWRGRPRRSLYQEALALGHTEMAELLARYGAERTPLAREGMDAFIDACLRLDRRRVAEIVAEHPEYLRNHRPVFAAIERDRADVLEVLLDLGASPDVEDAEFGGARALHNAAAKNAERCAQLLIERGAEIDPRETNFGSTPIGWASYFGHARMVELLGRHSRNVWTLTFRGLLDRLREVLSESPELAREMNEEGQTLLFWLPPDEAKALEAVEVLLEHGADPARRDRRGGSAADVADRRGLARAAARLRESA